MADNAINMPANSFCHPKVWIIHLFYVILHY